MTAFKPATLAAVCLLALVLCAPARAQHTIIDPDFNERVFSISYSGTVNTKHTFTGVRGQVRINHTQVGNPNPVALVFDAQPALGAKDSFYWNTDFTSVTALADTVKSVLKPTFTGPSDNHFYYMSPALYLNKQAPTQHESERIRWIDARAKPIRITAREGVLTARVQGNRITGMLWMTGYDSLGHQPVRFVANFEGEEYVREKPKE